MGVVLLSPSRPTVRPLGLELVRLLGDTRVGLDIVERVGVKEGDLEVESLDSTR